MRVSRNCLCQQKKKKRKGVKERGGVWKGKKERKGKISVQLKLTKKIQVKASKAQ